MIEADDIEEVAKVMTCEIVRQFNEGTLSYVASDINQDLDCFAVDGNVDLLKLAKVAINKTNELQWERLIEELKQ